MDQVRKNEIIAVVLFTVSLFLFLSIFTFSDQDLSFYTSTPNISPQNVTGVVGSYIGGFLLFFIGQAAYVFPLLIFIWGISRILQVEAQKMRFKVFGTIVLVTAVSSSLSMISNTTRTASFHSGGLIGSRISEFLIEYLGGVGATVFIVAMIILSVLVATEFLLFPILISAFRFLSGVPVKMKTIFPERIPNLEKFRAKRTAKDKLKEAKEEVARKIASMRLQVEEVRKTSLARRTDEKEKLRARSAAGSSPKIVTPEKARKAAPEPVRVAGVSDSSTGEKIEYKMPGIELLDKSSKEGVREREEDLKKKATMLENTLLEFGVEANVVKINRGPVITMYELEPAVGTKVNKITSLSDNISLSMRSANIRIVAPMPGKGTIGIEVPNDKSEKVLIRDIMETVEYRNDDTTLRMALGKDISGTPIIVDLGKMPHLLIAGSTGSGKTVCINAIISSLLYNASPDELKFMMIDPKRVELMMFDGIPHLVSPIVTNSKKAAAALNWVVSEMERRYEIFAKKGVRNITIYKEKKTEEEEPLPYIVVIVDELADLIMVAQQDVEGAIMRIAQLSRAAGIHMILATQRPSVNVITGVIKANFPARISFKVASKVDSRTVLDANGAEKLLGRGDMLLMEPGSSSLLRGQCSLVEDSEIRSLVKFIKSQAGPQYIEAAIEKQDTKFSGGVEQEKDDLYHEAVKMVVNTKQASVSMIQRKFRVGYTRAARMIDIMETEGVVGPYNGSKPRDILIEDIDSLEEE